MTTQLRGRSGLGGSGAETCPNVEAMVRVPRPTLKERLVRGPRRRLSPYERAPHAAVGREGTVRNPLALPSANDARKETIPLARLKSGIRKHPGRSGTPWHCPRSTARDQGSPSGISDIWSHIRTAARSIGPCSERRDPSARALPPGMNPATVTCFARSGRQTADQSTRKTVARATPRCSRRRFERGAEQPPTNLILFVLDEASRNFVSCQIVLVPGKGRFIWSISSSG
jgi:hypothetical protein